VHNQCIQFIKSVFYSFNGTLITRIGLIVTDIIYSKNLWISA